MLKITVVTADIMSSRKAGDYEPELKERLVSLQHPKLVSAFSLSRGDEIQGVLEGWLRAPEIVRHLRFACRPLRLRIGIGIGLQEGPIEANPWNMNGPAFHLARLALEAAQKERHPSTVIKTGHRELDEVLNCIWGLIDIRQMRWTDKQWEAVQAYEESKTYEGAARRLNITFQNVQKRCRSADWHRLREAEKTLGKLEIYAAHFHLGEGENIDFTSRRVNAGGTEQ